MTGRSPTTMCKHIATVAPVGAGTWSRKPVRSKTREAAIVVDPETRRFDQLPSSSGGITRLAHARLQAAGITADPLLQQAGVTQQQIDDPGLRVNVRDQIRFLNLAADALQDDLL